MSCPPPRTSRKVCLGYVARHRLADLHPTSQRPSFLTFVPLCDRTITEDSQNKRSPRQTTMTPPRRIKVSHSAAAEQGLPGQRSPLRPRPNDAAEPPFGSAHQLTTRSTGATGPREEKASPPLPSKRPHPPFARPHPHVEVRQAINSILPGWTTGARSRDVPRPCHRFLPPGSPDFRTELVGTGSRV